MITRIAASLAAAALSGGLLGLAWPLAGAHPDAGTGASEARASTSLDALLCEWPEAPRRAAEFVIALRGRPDVLTETLLAWYARPGHEHVLVFRDPVRADGAPPSDADHVLLVGEHAFAVP